MESQNPAEEPHNGGCRVSSCCASSFDGDDDEQDENADTIWIYPKVTKETLEETLKEIELIFEAELRDSPDFRFDLIVGSVVQVVSSRPHGPSDEQRYVTDQKEPS
jgi:hypothetical protein